MIWRRIHGHVVPIREKKEIAKGAAEVGAGAAVGALGGTAAAVTTRTASAIANRSKGKFRVAYVAHKLNQNQLHMPGLGVDPVKIKSTIKTAAKGRMAAKKLFRSRNGILAASVAVGATLAARGANRVANEIFPDRKDTFNGASAGIGALVAASTYSMYYRGLGFKGADVLKNTVARFHGIARPKQMKFKTKYGSGKI